MLGTVSDYSLREGHSSVAIIRSTARQVPPGSKLYMFATDGSRAAAVAYCMLVHQLVQPGDRLLLVSCSYDHSAPGNMSAAMEFKDYRDMADALKVGEAPTTSLQLRRHGSSCSSAAYVHALSKKPAAAFEVTSCGREVS
jgi:hypothetical protein